jgi:hypothetical protein
MLTVQELIDLLQTLPKDAKVLVHNTDGPGDLEFMTLRPMIEAHPVYLDEYKDYRFTCDKNDDDDSEPSQVDKAVYLLPDFGDKDKPFNPCDCGKYEVKDVSS